jgi:RimJ/RimL family protein N-acetyltransferase
MEQSPRPSIYLRALDVSDLERVFEWHNDSTLYAHLGGNFRWVSRAAEEEWIRRRCVYSPNEVNLAICISETHEHVGNVYLRDIDWVARHAELHIFIGSRERRRHGYGAEALQLVLAHAFNDLALQRIFLFVLESNESAQRLYKKCGFKEEGCLRQHIFKEGRFENILVMGILISEWKGNT